MIMTWISRSSLPLIKIKKVGIHSYIVSIKYWLSDFNVGVPHENYEWKLLAFANMKDLKRSLFLLFGNLTERSSGSLSLSGEATSITE